MTAVVVKHIDSGKWPLAIGDEYVGRNRIVTAQTNLYFTGLVAIALLLKKNFGLIAMLWGRGRC